MCIAFIGHMGHTYISVVYIRKSVAGMGGELSQEVTEFSCLSAVTHGRSAGTVVRRGILMTTVSVVLVNFGRR